MSWLFSRALVEAYSAENFLDGEPSVPSNGNPIPQAYCAPDRMTKFSRLSRFGMTYAPLTASRGEELLTWYLAGFPAKTLVPQDTVQESPAVDQDSGLKWRESSVKYCRNSYSWKTHRCLWAEDLPSLSVTLPQWGMTRNGLVFQHLTSKRPINVTESGSLLPTPTATDWKGGTTAIRKDKELQRMDQFRHWIKCVHGLTYPIPEHSEAMMGFPLGWTDLKPLATDKFQEWQPQHSNF